MPYAGGAAEEQARWLPGRDVLAAVGALREALATALALEGQGLGARALETDAEIPSAYLREATNEIDTRFPRLPNPAVVMYVFPHLAEAEGVPVPGYVTTFPMYERVEYALPGEVPPGAVP
jgi:conjugative transfer region lipoprotein (TIGR03751 family)